MDIIIVSCGKSKYHRQLTQNTINSCLNSKGDYDIIVIETCEGKYDYAKTILFTEPFNYNRCLNLGTQHSKGQYIAYCNNDLEFHKDWSQNIIKVFENHGYLSLSPYEPNYHNHEKGSHLFEGYQCGIHMPGWCICVNRDIWEKLGKFDEGVDFWYSDNIYCDQLMKHRVKHAIVCNSFVTHVQGGSLSLNKEPKHKQLELTHRNKRKYEIAKKNLQNG